MGELLNLNRARKRRDKDDVQKTAKVNRTKFGRTKLDRDNEVAKAARASKRLDQHKLPTEDVT